MYNPSTVEYTIEYPTNLYFLRVTMHTHCMAFSLVL